MLNADYYDGRSARRQAVTLDHLGPLLRVRGESVHRDANFASVEISEKLGRGARMIRFADGAHCEVRDHEAFERLLAGIGHREGLVDRWQRRWAPAVASTLLLVVATAAVYVWGLPWFSARVAANLPTGIVQAMSAQALKALDGHTLQPSQLKAERQQKLLDEFAALRGSGPAQSRLLFRSSPLLGANAMALPDGTIVLLDQLVGLADNDQQIVAALAHELGHVQQRHGLDLLLRGAIVGAFTAWWIGDFSSLIAAAPAAVLQARHSREFEEQADAYAATLLRKRGISTARLAEILSKLRDAHREQADDEQDWSDYLSSHPATDERIRALRELH